MMQAFRNSTKVIAVVFAVILLVWLLGEVSGLGNSIGSSGARTVGRINGTSIDTRTYEARVRQVTDQQQRANPAALTLEDQQQIRDQVWDEFLATNLLEAQYKEHGLTVTDDEVADAVRNNPPPELQQAPEFQTDGKFDMGKYQRWLTSSAATPYVDAIGAQYRDILLRNKLLRIVTADVVLSDAALWERYRDEHEQVKIGLTAIVPRNVIPDSAVSITPEEVNAYYRAHEAEFKRPATAYLSFVRLDRTPSATDTAAALERVRKIREAIVGGEPFDEVAKRESSDTVSGSKGGDLGEWTRGQFAPAFDSVAFSIPLKTLSQPVLTQFGYHLLEITSRTGDKAKGRHILVPIELTGAHRDSIDAETDTLDRISSNASDASALDSAARALRLPIGRTAPVPKGSRALVGQTVVPDAGVWAFQARPGQLSQVIEAPDAAYLFRLDSVDAEGVPPIERIRPAVEFVVRDQKKRALARRVAEDYLKRVGEGSTPEQAAKALSLAHREFGPFTRLSPPLDIPQLVGASFGLDAGQRSGVIETKDGLYVIQTLEHIPADSAAFAKDLDAYRASTIRGLREERVRQYLAALRAQAKVVDNRDKIYQQQNAAQQQAPLTPS
ncbi:MAG TPA: SurA N-terminal domain-containing protein [Gemmatimonadales bacterium]|jgi:peptidyl-prolyl cis-trans isomerase D|nr:SurA N-terminal domain-containing protein [Gemmatimonadales bacterium]